MAELKSLVTNDMQRKDLVLLFSRTFALILTSWALAEVSYLPERLFTLAHHISQGSVLARYDYWSSYHLVVASFLVVRVFGLLLAARLFWKCGPRIQALFSPQQRDEQ